MRSRMLAALKGPVAPADWRGALPITYHIGPGRRKVHLKLAFNWDIKPLYNVIVRIPGSTLSRRVDHPRQPSRRLGQRRRGSGLRRGAADGGDARAGRAAEAGMEAEAHDHLLRVGRRRAGTAGVHRMGRGARRGTAAQGRGVHQHRRQRPRDAARGRLAHAGEVHQRRRARTSRIPKPRSRCGSGLQAERLANAAAAGSQRGAHAAGPAHRRARLGFGLHGVSGSPRGRVSVNLGFGGEDRGGIYHSIYDDFYWYTHFSDTEFVYGRALAQTGRHGGDAAWPTPNCCRSISTISPIPCGATSTRCRSWRATSATRPWSATG